MSFVVFPGVTSSSGNLQMICGLRRSGLTVETIANRLGMTPAEVRKVLDRAEEEYRRRRR